MIRLYDMVVTKEQINKEIPKGTRGTVLEILENDRVFLVEFVNDLNETLGDGMTVVQAHQVVKVWGTANRNINTD